VSSLVLVDYPFVTFDGRVLRCFLALLFVPNFYSSLALIDPIVLSLARLNDLFGWSVKIDALFSDAAKSNAIKCQLL